jgi:uncharacterized membrane protein YwzB
MKLNIRVKRKIIVSFVLFFITIIIATRVYSYFTSYVSANGRLFYRFWRKV